MNPKRILLLIIAFVLLTTNAFAYPSLKGDCAYIGKNDWYWIEIDTSQEYYWDDPNGYPAADVVIVLSLNDEGRKKFFGNVPGSYKDEAQWYVQHIRYEFYPNYGVSQILSYQILDANKNVMYENMKPGKLESWGESWLANNVVGFIHEQFRNGAYTNSDGKVCYK